MSQKRGEVPTQIYEFVLVNFVLQLARDTLYYALFGIMSASCASNWPVRASTMKKGAHLLQVSALFLVPSSV